MFNTPGHDEEFSGVQFHLPVSEFNAESTGHYEKEFIFVLVVVPDELTLEFGELHLLPVQLSDDMRVPVVGNLGELFGQAYGLITQDLLLVSGNSEGGLSRLFREYGCRW